MIYLRLFLTFLKIGAFSFGGGYGMISLMREECLSNSWLTEEELLNVIAVAESTPGPIAVNMATFVGSSQGGVLGALLATLGVVLPSFLILLLIAMLLKRVLRYAGVNVALKSVRPAVCGLIVATAFTMLLKAVCAISTFSTLQSTFAFDWKAIVIFAILIALTIGYRKWKKKPFSPFLLIVIAGGLGLAFYL